MADLRRVVHPALRHRLIPSFEAEAEGIDTDAILEKLLEEIPEVEDGVAAIAG
jgi:MoxR-like ATPase